MHYLTQLLLPFVSFLPQAATQVTDHLFTSAHYHHKHAIAQKVEHLHKNGSCVSDFLQESIYAIHEHNRAAIKKAFAITDTEWNNLYETFDYMQENDPIWTDHPIIKHRKNDPAIVKRARVLLASQGIDPEQITIVTYHNPKSMSNAALEQAYTTHVFHRLSINLSRITRLSAARQDAILLHEIMHLVHYDPLERGLIMQLLEKKGMNEKNIDEHPAIRNFYKHQEMRADLLSASLDIKLARACHAHYHEHAQKFAENSIEWTTHPSDLQRSKDLHRLIAFMEHEEQLLMKAPSTAIEDQKLA